MTLAAGRLRHRIELQAQVQTQNPVTGEMTTAWVTQAAVWAAIEPLSAREFIAAESTQSQVTARITVRHLPGIDASWRAVHRGKVYNIHGVLADPVSGLEYLTLPVSAGVNDGQ